ncbi:MAG: hypothetical protein WAW39_21730 [Prosthecobacter sp.]|uniref:hypothetical protein n=1 Tax=Prosthecobacter sp. TaxID=1965333 RepID=UPI003BB01B7C
MSLAARKNKALTLREQWLCTLLWRPNSSVLAREGVSQESQELGGIVVRKHCKFYVLRELLAVAPGIGAVFSLDGRSGETWRLDKIRGRSPNDVEWIFECVEEYR